MNKNEKEFPLFTGQLSCGLFGISEDFTEEGLSLDQKFMRNKESTFFIRAGGDSMEPQIRARDILVVDRSLKLFNNCVAAFYFNGNAICKIYRKTESGIVLHSLNSKYKDIHIKEHDELELFGVVVGLVRDLL